MYEVMYSEKITVYMSYEQRREIERAARAAHLKVSDWCRRDLAAAVATLRYLRKAQKRLEIGLIIGFVLLYVWAQWPAICLLARWMWLWRHW